MVVWGILGWGWVCLGFYPLVANIVVVIWGALGWDCTYPFVASMRGVTLQFGVPLAEAKHSVRHCLVKI